MVRGDLKEGVNVRLTEADAERLRALASREQMAMSTVIRRFVRRGLDEVERDVFRDTAPARGESPPRRRAVSAR